MKNLYLCSFASPDLNISVKRFISQSKEVGLYKNIKVFGWQDLKLEKKKQINSFLEKKNKRLFGYACWKPDIILDYLNNIPEGSILQYSDIGCHFNKNGITRLKEYVEIVSEKNILPFQYKKPEFKNDLELKFQIYLEHHYTKADLFDYFKVSNDSPIKYSEQIWSGTIFFKNNVNTKNFVKDWVKTCSINNLIDDSPSVLMNSEEFIEHRHDQSVFSLLCKLNNFSCLSASECEWAENKKGRYWDHLINYPILAKRDKKLNIFKRFFSRQFKNIKRFIKK